MRHAPLFAARILAAFLLLTGAASAQTLQTCAGQGGTTAYRSGDCLPNERLIAIREAGPDPRPPSTVQVETGPAKPALAITRSHRAPTARRVTNPRRASKRRKSAPNTCASARRARDDFQRRRGIKVTMAELSRWNHKVYDACK